MIASSTLLIFILSSYPGLIRAIAARCVTNAFWYDYWADWRYIQSNKQIIVDWQFVTCWFMSCCPDLLQWWHKCCYIKIFTEFLKITIKKLFIDLEWWPASDFEKKNMTDGYDTPKAYRKILLCHCTLSPFTTHARLHALCQTLKKESTIHIVYPH